MAEKRTGLGQTLDEFQIINGDVELSELYYGAKKRYEGADVYTQSMGELSLADDKLDIGNGIEVLVDEQAYEQLCNMLKIPFKYLMRVNKELRKENVEYWFNYYEDKDVEITVKGDTLIDIHEGMEIKVCDVLGLLDVAIDGAKVFNSVAKKNSSVIDVYDETCSFDVDDETWLGGLRVEIRVGLKAPIISPILINVDSCGIVECSHFLEPLNIKSLSYADILNVIGERMDNCVSALPKLFSSMERVYGNDVPNPRRRIALYCREHGIPERIKAYTLAQFDESGLERASLGDIINLFSVIGYIGEVKQTSAVKMHRLAGYIVMKAMAESRCPNCDATLIE